MNTTNLGSRWPPTPHPLTLHITHPSTPTTNQKCRQRQNDSCVRTEAGRHRRVSAIYNEVDTYCELPSVTGNSSTDNRRITVAQYHYYKLQSLACITFTIMKQLYQTKEHRNHAAKRQSSHFNKT
jgi:hypothetical protein